MLSKINQSEQLQAVVHPEVLILFEDWMEELEFEVLKRVAGRNLPDALDLADDLGMSRSGVQFLLTKLEMEGKI